MSSDDHVGMIPVPPGKTANFDLNHLTPLQVQYVIAYTITFVVATCALVMRLYTRIWIVHLPGLDDIITILAWATSIISLSLTCWAMKHGFGKHMWEVVASDFQKFLKIAIPITIIYCISTALTKISILILLRRLNPNRWFRFSIYLLGFLLIVYTAVFSIVISTICNPKNPDKTECAVTLVLWQSILNILADVAIILLPLPMIYFLNIHLREKIALAGVLSAGMGVVIISIVRITHVMAMRNNPDVIHSEYVSAIWGACEVNIGIICNCVVILKPFLRKHFPGLFSSRGKSSGIHGTSRTRSYAVFSNRQNTFQLTSVSNIEHSKIGKDGKGDNGGIMVTNSYAVEEGSSYGKKDAETDSTEDIMGSSRRSDYT